MAATGVTRPPPPGALVSVRGRDWVVLPSAEPDVALLRPLTGGDETPVGIFLPLEGRSIAPASFPLPDPDRTGDATASLLLYDAARLSLRSGAAPFRSLGRVSVTPRPYQFVPLLMALRQHPVRLLVADDVGVGKTIEAALIARELLDRGVARRLAVLCPAHLCDQWERELHEKFALDAVVVQPARIARLERDLPRADQSIYQHYRHLVASIDFVKSDRHRGHFLAHAPDLVIVDEAHTAARPGATAQRTEHQRYELVRELAADPRRHLVLVTATPHSGIEESFRSLLGLLKPEFDVPGARAAGQDARVDVAADDLDRRRLVPHVVQRRRSDIARWLGAATPFPERESEERTYRLSAAYQSLFEDVLAYCREAVRAQPGVRAHHQRVRHWAAIALLRCVLSSPEAAASVVAKRARRRREAGQGEPAPLDEPGPDGAGAAGDLDFYGAQVLDAGDEGEATDYVPSAPLAEAPLDAAEQRRLAEFLRRARALAQPEADAKLAEAARIVAEQLRAGHHPIVFCRFIPTARYLETWLPQLLGREFPGLRAVAVTGEIGDEERRAKVEELTAEPVRVLVATDCLSEGINLQQHFDAVLHYDLPWNPNRLEQREGRVDRFGQPRRSVKTSLLHGADNAVDLVVLDVLIRKARTIRRRLGVSVPVPAESEQVVQAVVNSVLLRRPDRAPAGVQLQLGLADPEVSRLHEAWDAAAERERRQRTFFGQHGIQPDEVAREIDATDPVLGDAAAVQRFLANAAQRFGGALAATREPDVQLLSPGDLRHALEARGYARFPLRVTFETAAARIEPPANGRVEPPLRLGRTHPLVNAYCDAVLGAAVDDAPDARFARSGAMLTGAVRLRTGVLLLRLRYLLREVSDQFAEEVVLAAFQRREGRLQWLEPSGTAAIDLMGDARPAANLSPAERGEHVRWALDLIGREADWFRPIVDARVGELQAAHNRLRAVARIARLRVEPRTPPDVLGCYVLVPAAAAGGI